MTKYKILFLIFFFSFLSIFAAQSKLKVLHLSFHQGCIKEIEYLSKELQFDLTTMDIHNTDAAIFGVKKGSLRYNITHTMAERCWEINQDYFNAFDLIITSDTAPLSRIFLQNNFSKPLIIWVCNRFDYCDVASLPECLPEKFPDAEYYQLIRSISYRPNVSIISYTPFEHVYAKKFHNVDVWNDVIRPSGFSILSESTQSAIPSNVEKQVTFFVPPYHNDTVYQLSSILNSLKIPNYFGRYAGPNDLKDFKGIIHIPYAWSNLALFENWANGMIYFIPSRRFLEKISKTGNFFWSPPFHKEHLIHSEWYNPEHKDLFVFFDSWNDLKEKIITTNYAEKRKMIERFASQHREKMINQWKVLIQSTISNGREN